MDNGLKNKLRLSALVEGDMISFVEKSGDRVQGYRKIPLGELSSDASLQHKLHNADEVVFCMVEPRYQLLPGDHFEAGKESILMAALTDISKGYIQRSFSIGSLDLKGAYLIPAPLFRTIIELKMDARFVHFAATFLPRAIKLEQTAVFLHLLDRHFHLAVIDNGSLLLSAIYEYRTREDILYYTLAAYQRFEMDTAVVPGIASGLIESDGQYHKLLRDYIKDLRLAEFRDFESNVPLEIPSNHLMAFH